jgi:chromosome segregation ATPase
MSASEAVSEPTLFDQKFSAPAADDSPPVPVADEPTRRASPAAALGSDVTSDDVAATAPVAANGAVSAEAAAQSERKRLAEQLDALKRKEFELRRALVKADHPELVSAIRAIEGRAYAVSLAEGKLARGYSKSEARRREVVEKKLASLRDKRAELDTQIGALETELGGLGNERLATFESERTQAIEQLVVALGSHVAALDAAGLDAASLIPEIAGWLPEIEAIAKRA